MEIVYQGRTVETDARTVQEFLAEKNVVAEKAIVEYAGEVYAPGADLRALVLQPGAALDVFKMMAGG